jgi:hypothetical protein
MYNGFLIAKTTNFILVVKALQERTTTSVDYNVIIDYFLSTHSFSTLLVDIILTHRQQKQKCQKHQCVQQESKVRSFIRILRSEAT